MIIAPNMELPKTSLCGVPAFIPKTEAENRDCCYPGPNCQPWLWRWDLARGQVQEMEGWRTKEEVRGRFSVCWQALTSSPTGVCSLIWQPLNRRKWTSGLCWDSRTAELEMSKQQQHMHENTLSPPCSLTACRPQPWGLHPGPAASPQLFSQLQCEATKFLPPTQRKRWVTEQTLVWSPRNHLLYFSCVASWWRFLIATKNTGPPKADAK